MSDLARNILTTVFCFSKSKGNITHDTIDIQDGVPIKINDDLVIKPILVDHSAYNSFMFLIEADNKRILYTGDYRNHGYKGKLFKPTLRKIRKDRHTNHRGNNTIKTKCQSTNRGRTSKRDSRKDKGLRPSASFNIYNYNRPNYNSSPCLKR